MNRLQKKAWINLAAITACVVLTGMCLGILVHINARGFDSLLVGLVPGLVAGLVFYVRSMAEEAKLDEREKTIARKSFVWACYTLTLFWACASFGIFFVAGGKSVVPAYTLPVVFLAGLFLAQFVESAAILIQFARETADE
jgi:hypothetical protein